MRALGLILLLSAAPLGAAELTDRMTLVQAIEAVRAEGVAITYSSRLVQPWMRVRNTPGAADPLEGLREVLSSYRLALEPGPQGQWLVVQSDGAEPVLAANAAADPAPAAAPRYRPKLDEVKIVASRYSLFDRNSVSDQFLTGEEVRLLPHIADDAFRAFHRLPGAAATDFSASFNLRGGAKGEVKVVLDDLELFEPFHMRTLFSPLSVIDPGIIENAHVLSGGFNANYGNHMSGVIDITSRQPEGEAVHELGVSFVNSFFRSMGGFGSGGSYIIAARRGYLDLLADSVTEEGEELSPRYSDAFAKIAYPLSERTDMAAHVLVASDRVVFVDVLDGESMDDDSALAYAWLTLDSELSDRVLWKNVLFTGSVSNEDQGSLRNLPFENVERFFDRDVSISGAQSSLSLRLDEGRSLMLGLHGRRLEADYHYKIDSLRQTDLANQGKPRIIQRDIVSSHDGGEYGVSARYRFQPTPNSTWELGLRWDQQTYTDLQDESQLSPRVNALFNLGNNTSLRLGWGYFYQPQGVHELQVEDGVTDFFPAEESEHRVVGIQHLFSNGLDLQVELYQKRYSELRPRYENVLDSFEYMGETDFDRIRIEPDSAEAKGMEFTLRNRGAGQFDWWLNYSWSQANDDIAGVTVPRSWDQRHAVTGNLTWHGEKWTLSLVARYHSGWPQTPLLVRSILDEGGALIGFDGDLSQRNAAQFEDYFRVDARLSRTVALARGSFQYYFEIFNLTNAKNQCCVSGFDVTFDQTVRASPNFDEFLPFFPAFGFVWTFGPGAAGN